MRAPDSLPDLVVTKNRKRKSTCGTILPFRHVPEDLRKAGMRDHVRRRRMGQGTMPLIALLPDIHANLAALTAVVGEVERLGVDRIVCCGDIVGYGMEPAACVRMLRERGATSVLGNHEAMMLLAMRQPSQVPSREASRNNPVWNGIHRALEELDEGDVSWLASLPRVLEIPGAIVAHAALHGGEGWPYLLDSKHARLTLDLMKRHGHAIGFFGHTHRQEWFSLPGDPANEPRETSGFRLDEGVAYAVTTGSVGRPRGSNPNPTWTLWDSERKVFEFRSEPVGNSIRPMSVSD